MVLLEIKSLVAALGSSPQNDWSIGRIIHVERMRKFRETEILGDSILPQKRDLKHIRPL